MPHSSSYALVVGVDIAAKTFTASFILDHLPPSPAQTFAQSPAGYRAFQQALRATGVAPASTLILLEATGSYWVTFAVTLHEAGFVLSVCNPAKARAYIQSQGRGPKSDARDTQLLTQFAAERHHDAWTPPPAVYHEVRQRLVARDQLVAMRKQALNQVHALEQWPVVVESVREHQTALIAHFTMQIKALERELKTVLADGAWAASAQALQSIPGVGVITSGWLLVATVGFTVCGTAKAAVGFAGLNPLKDQSGTSRRGKEHIGHGGHARLRGALYEATMSGVRFNPVLKSFYERLIGEGKAEKVARCAAARKLLVLAWAIGTTGSRFEPSYQKPPSDRLEEQGLLMKSAA